MTTFQILTTISLLMMAAMCVLYGLQLRKRDASLADLGWTGGMGLMAIFLAYQGTGWAPRRAVVALLVLVWSVRLFHYLLRDRIAGKEEDARYQALRAHWGAHANRNFFWLFQAQALLVALFSMALFVLMNNPTIGFAPWEVAGVFMWFISVLGEAVADRQLSVFRANPDSSGLVCRQGVWRYSRHPNYFFEWLHWCSYVVIGIGAPHGWMTLVAPVLMWVFLWRVTGIPATEKRALSSRGEAYREYQRTTSVFFPWFPKTSA